MSNQLKRVVLCLYDDLLTKFPTAKVEVNRDKARARKCLALGDLSLWTTQLPAVHNDALYALEHGSAPPKMDHLGWLLRLVWDNPTSDIAAEALLAHRQLSHFLYKLELPYAVETIEKTLDSFIATEDFLANALDKVLGSDTSSLIRSYAREALFQALPTEGINPLGVTERVRERWGALPHHGPGAVATGERGVEKWRFKRLYLSAHRRFPWYDWFMPRGRRCLEDRVKWYRGLERLESPCASVVLVPKDSRGPRIISEEPLEIQYLQQAYSGLMHRWAKRPLLAGHVFFDDQEVHRALALSSSRSRDYATLDLKDASDRVSIDLVADIFPDAIAKDLLALRSHATILPDGRVVRLRKYAPMGSSTCFPTMAFTIWAVSRAALRWDAELGGVDRESVSDVFVFGDDLIVPARAVDSVRLALYSVGLLVNEKKSFSSSHFRESCGVDAYNGVDITPTRLRRLPGSRSSRDSTFFSYLAYVNHMREKGWLKTADSLQALAASVYGELPLTWNSAKMPGIEVPWPTPLNTRTRWSTPHSRLEAQGWVPKPPQTLDSLDEWEGLLRGLVEPHRIPSRYETSRGKVIVRKRWLDVSPS